MSGRNGRPPVPVERKRARGNPGGRALPDPAKVTHIAAVRDIPEPPRPLGASGRELWDRCWGAARSWLAPDTDMEAILMVAEQVDERVALRVRVLRSNDPTDRKALRDLDRQILTGLSMLGFTPTDRARLGVAEVVAASTLERLRERRGS